MNPLTTLRRSLVLAAIPAAMLATAALPAEAVGMVGAVDSISYGASGSASGTCAYTATLPSTSGFNYISVAFSGTARATASRVGVVAVSTSIRCYLRYDAWGEAGITLPGSVATIAGRGDVYRLALNPQICAVVSAAFSDGSTAPSTTTCINL